MNTPTEPAINPMQSTEVFPLEDRSAPASDVIIEQQAERADDNVTPTFIPYLRRGEEKMFSIAFHPP